MPKLYRVDLKVSTYVIADDREAAQEVATAALAHGDIDDADSAVVLEVRTLAGVSARWRNAYPFRGDKVRAEDGQTCEQFLEDPRGGEGEGVTTDD